MLFSQDFLNLHFNILEDLAFSHSRTIVNKFFLCSIPSFTSWSISLFFFLIMKSWLGRRGAILLQRNHRFISEFSVSPLGEVVYWLSICKVHSGIIWMQDRRSGNVFHCLFCQMELTCIIDHLLARVADIPVSDLESSSHSCPCRSYLVVVVLRANGFLYCPFSLAVVCIHVCLYVCIHYVLVYTFLV